MLVAFTILSLLCCVSSNSLLIEYPEKDPQKACVEIILRKYFIETKMLIFVDLQFKDDTFLEYIHSMNIVAISISRFLKQWRFNQAYMFVTGDVDLLIQRVSIFNKEGSLNPYARFLIVIRSLKYDNLEQIFNALLQFRLYHVVVVNGTETAELYTYNPFEDYGCGKFYTKVIELGKCNDTGSVDLYPSKTITGLRNCVLTVSCAHWPPYSIDPVLSVDYNSETGVEQHILHIMSKVEHFKYNFVFDYDPEMFSVVSESQKGVTVSGPLTLLQTNQSDVMLGGLVLSQSRANMFTYVHGYLDQVEELKLMVKKASLTPAWKDFYIEFSSLVWSLILLVFLLYALILIILLKDQEKGRVLLVLLDNLLLHGTKIKARNSVNVVFFFWVLFAYLINCFYQSVLVSRTTKPSLEYQINDEETLYARNLKPCISKVMKTIMELEESKISRSFDNSTDVSCDRYLQSIRTVSKSKDKFTAILYTVYLYNKLSFYDEYGMSEVHSISKPFTKVIYAMYFYKGFFAGDRLYSLSLRIRETGLSDKNLEWQYASKRLKYQFHNREFETRFSIPWCVYTVGICISALTFFVEIIIISARGWLDGRRLPGAPTSAHSIVHKPT